MPHSPSVAWASRKGPIRSSARSPTRCPMCVRSRAFGLGLLGRSRGGRAAHESTRRSGLDRARPRGRGAGPHRRRLGCGGDRRGRQGGGLCRTDCGDRPGRRRRRGAECPAAAAGGGSLSAVSLCAREAEGLRAARRRRARSGRPADRPLVADRIRAPANRRSARRPGPARSGPRPRSVHDRLRRARARSGQASGRRRGALAAGCSGNAGFARCAVGRALAGADRRGGGGNRARGDRSRAQHRSERPAGGDHRARPASRTRCARAPVRSDRRSLAVDSSRRDPGHRAARRRRISADAVRPRPGSALERAGCPRVGPWRTAVRSGAAETHAYARRRGSPRRSRRS